MAYDTGWVSIVDLELGSSVANKLDVAFGNIDTALDALETTEQNTDTNTADIAVLETTSSDHETRITALEAVQAMQYEFASIPTPMSITEDTFQEVVRVGINQLNNGIFEYKLTVLFRYNTTGSSAVFRYAIIRNDNPAPVWREIWEEPKDVTNNMNLDLFYAIDEQNGDKVELALQARCEASGHQLDIDFGQVIIDQKR